MRIEYKRDMGRNYIVFSEGIELSEGYFLKLIQNGQVKGILPLEVRTVDGKKECFCDITGKQALHTVFGQSGIDRGQLEEILQKIQKIIKDGEEYLLKPEDYVLTAESIFLDLSDFSIFLCYLPGYQKPMEEKWKEFTEYPMNVADYKKEDTVLYVYSLYKAARQPGGFMELFPAKQQELNMYRKEESFRRTELAGKAELFTEPEPFFKREPEKRKIYTNIPEFEERIEEDETVEKYPLKIYLPTAAVVAVSIAAAAAGLFLWRPGVVQAGAYLFVLGAVCVYAVSRLFSPENKETRVEHRVEFVPAEEEEDEWDKEREDFEEIEERTMILAGGNGEKNCFLRAEDSRKYRDIELIEFPFFFGKLHTRVNSMIESPAVSRFHAKIEHLGGEYYLVDLNSTNGTFLNGERLQSQERKKLTPMDKIRFADVGYYFEAEIS